jgi:hypothetical protein
MANIARTAYNRVRVVPETKTAIKDQAKSAGLLGRMTTPKKTQKQVEKSPQERIAEYVSQIRAEREKFKNAYK